MDDQAQDRPFDDEQMRWFTGVVFDRVAQQQGEVEQLARAAPGSPLTGDDRAAHPYEVSHAAYRALVAATEQLDALRALLLDARVMHPTAPYTLVRAAIETGAAAVWLLAPATRAERVVRSLQLMVGDAVDGDTVATEIGSTVPRPLADRRAEIDRLARAVRPDVRTPLRRASSTDIVRAAQEHGPSEIHALTAWRVCSGFAHGRLWATLSVLPREVIELDDPGMVGLRFTNSWKPLTWAAMTAVDVVDRGLDLYRARAASPWAAR